MSTSLSRAAVNALSSVIVRGNQTTMPQLDRKLYVEVNEALEVLGGKWNRKAKAHVFEGDPREAIARIVEDGEFTDRARELEFFETPAELADRMVEEANIGSGMTVLEPSAGQGALVLAILRARPKVEIIAFELNDDFVDPLYHAHFNGARFSIDCEDFLEIDFPRTPSSQVDRVVMNPPFSKGQDAAHITRAFQWLKPGGRLVGIAAAGVTFRQEKAMVDFRALVAKHGAFIDLPAGSFKSSGTMVNTVMITMDRPR